MSKAIKPLFSFYYDNTMVNIISLPLPAQLRRLNGLRIVLFDYCGMVCKYIKAFRDADAKIFLMDNIVEDPRALPKEHDEALPKEYDGALPKEYDVVYVMVHENQSAHINFKCILVVFRSNSIVRVVYQR